MLDRGIVSMILLIVLFEVIGDLVVFAEFHRSASDGQTLDGLGLIQAEFRGRTRAPAHEQTSKSCLCGDDGNGRLKTHGLFARVAFGECP